MILPNPFPGKSPRITINPTPVISMPTPYASSFKAVKAGTQKCLAVLIADASGSMSSFVNDTIGGVNAFVNKLKADDSVPTNLLFVTFESNSVRTVIDNADIREVPQITGAHYLIGGSTNLIDAVGETIEKVNAFLKSKRKKDRPSVIFQIITDGQENSSRRYNNAQLKDMVTKAQEKDWVFSFVGANIDSFSVAHSFGVAQTAVSNYLQSHTSETFGAMASSMVSARSLRSKGLAGAEVTASYYTDDDRKKMGGA